MRVLIIGKLSYSTAFSRFPDVSFTACTAHTANINKAYNDVNLVCFTGGADIDPSMYGEEDHHTTHSELDRDIEEAKLFHNCVAAGVSMVGICRGAQLLTVMNGGKLIQNVTNHGISDTHEMKGILEAEVAGDKARKFAFPVNSTHHQMMYPYILDNSEFRIIGWSENVADHYEGLPAEEFDKGIFIYPAVKTKRNFCLEPEVVYYKGSNSLAVQYHPEKMTKESPALNFFTSAVRQYLKVG